MKKTLDRVNIEPMLDELRDIKRLLILSLLKAGASQSDIARALGINQSSISRMLPGKVGQVRETVGRPS